MLSTVRKKFWTICSILLLCVLSNTALACEWKGKFTEVQVNTWVLEAEKVGMPEYVYVGYNYTIVDKDKGTTTYEKASAVMTLYAYVYEYGQLLPQDILDYKLRGIFIRDVIRILETI